MLIRKLVTRGMSVLVLLGSLWLCVTLWGSSSRNNRTDASAYAEGLNAAARHLKKRKAFLPHHQQQQQHRTHRASDNGGGGDDSSSFSLSEANLHRILNAQVHLIELRVHSDEVERNKRSQTSYSGVYGTFCRLNWSLHKSNPSQYPMFRDLIANSPDCQGDNLITNVDISKITQRARKYDATTPTVNVLNLTAVVFHESRCGSTLTANLLAAMEPTQHRVYSESSPPLQALAQVCGDDYSNCPLETAASVLTDVIYLMSRSDDPAERRVFFKIQSAGTRNLPVFTTAFPTTPYLFVYRDPVQVMISHLKQGLLSANCVRSRSHPPSSVLDVIQKYAPASHTTTTDLSPQDYCAAHLASITETVVSHLTPAGIPVNYKDLPLALSDTIFPRIFSGGKLSPAQLSRMQATATVYSKNRDRPVTAFQSDSALKEKMASPEVQSAAATFLSSSYAALEQLAAAAKQGPSPP